MRVSTAQEAINGNDNNSVITPLRLKQVLNGYSFPEGGGGSNSGVDGATVDKKITQSINDLRMNKTLVPFIYYIDHLDGNDITGDGSADRPFKSLDRFFEEANKVKGNQTDIRCRLKGLSNYHVSSSIQSISGMNLYIDAVYNGNPTQATITFDCAGNIEFYNCNIILKNLEILAPNANIIYFRGGFVELTNIEFGSNIATYFRGCSGIVETITTRLIKAYNCNLHLHVIDIKNTDPAQDAYYFNNCVIRLYGACQNARLSSRGTSNKFVYANNSVISYAISLRPQSYTYYYGFYGSGSILIGPGEFIDMLTENSQSGYKPYDANDIPNFYIDYKVNSSRSLRLSELIDMAKPEVLVSDSTPTDGEDVWFDTTNNRMYILRQHQDGSSSYEVFLDLNNLPTAYELPIASADTLGGIKVGDNLRIDEDGTLHALGGGGGDGTSVDTVPINSIFGYDGETPPDGYVEIDNVPVVDNVISRNLLYTPYTVDNKFKFTALKDDHYTHIGYYANLEAGKTYTLSAETDAEVWGHTGDVELYICYNDKYDEYYGASDNMPFVFQPKNTGKYYIRVDVNKAGETYSFWNFQIEEGNEATEFVPYLNLQRNVLTDTVARLNNVVSRNIFNKETMIELYGYYRSAQFDGRISVNADYVTIKVPVKPNTTYSFSTNVTAGFRSNLCYFDANFTFISGESFSQGEPSFSTPDNCYYVTIAVAKIFEWVQIEEGTEITPFVPYVNLEEAMKEHNVYSTEEKIVGTYLGKPLYRKTFELGELGSSSRTVDYTLTGNFERIVHHDAYLHNSSGTNSLPAYFENGNFMFVNIYISSGSAVVSTYRSAVNVWSGWRVVVTLEYTKTN